MGSNEKWCSLLQPDHFRVVGMGKEILPSTRRNALKLINFKRDAVTGHKRSRRPRCRQHGSWQIKLPPRWIITINRCVLTESAQSGSCVGFLNLIKYLITHKIVHLLAVLAWKRSRFVFRLYSANMDGFFWNLECRFTQGMT